MVIYLEGVDGSGKTTLANAIILYLTKRGIDAKINNVLAEGTMPNNPNRMTKDELIMTMFELIDDETIHICDRGPLSDIVYRTFDDYEPLMTLDLLMRIHNVCRSNRYMVILCDTDQSEKLMLARGDDNPIAIKRHREIRYLYKQMSTVLEVKHFDLVEDIMLDFVQDLFK